jgi:hypothetical protein
MTYSLVHLLTRYHRRQDLDMLHQPHPSGELRGSTSDGDGDGDGGGGGEGTDGDLPPGRRIARMLVREEDDDIELLPNESASSGVSAAAAAAAAAAVAPVAVTAAAAVAAAAAAPVAAVTALPAPAKLVAGADAGGDHGHGHNGGGDAYIDEHSLVHDDLAPAFALLPPQLKTVDTLRALKVSKGEGKATK